MATGLKDRLARQASGDSDLDFDPIGASEPRLVFVLTDLIDPDPNQPRKNQGDLTELASSIREHGVINPIIVEVAGSGRYCVIAGERRYAACRRLGLETVPCIVRTVAEQSRLELQLIENLHRQDLHPVEEARAFKRLMDEFGFTQRDLAQRLGKSLAAINQMLRILDLKQDLLAAVQTSERANKSLLLEIAKQTDPQRQQALWLEAEAGRLTVRQARARNQRQTAPKRDQAKAVLELPEAKITIRFRAGESTSGRVCEALELALSLQRNPT